jgi:CDP-4-dehydro-6-deoxyglucose reductase
MYTVTLLSGKTFGADIGQSLIEAAEAAGITLPYSCRNGRCSSCKCRLKGPTEVIFDEVGLSTDEKRDGWSLACARSALGSVSLDIDDLGDIKLPSAKVFPAKINSLELMSNDVLKLTLRLPPGRDFVFFEGQYIELAGPNGISRSYSLARLCDGNLLEFQIRRVTGGQMSDYLFGNAKLNDLVRINGPHGTFVLRHGPETDIVFLATGTGIAPIKAMLERIKKMPAELKPKTVRLFWGARHASDLYWDPQDAFPELKYTPVLSRPDAKWTGEFGYVQDAMMKTQDENARETQVYACGSDVMIRSTRVQIENLGLSLNFFSDAFVVSG